MIKKGFTLMELLIVIAIIGILAGVVMVSSGGGVEKSKRASALTTMSSLLPELVTCADDGGFGIKSVAPTTAAFICCKTAASTITSCDSLGGDNADGHTLKWPDLLTKTGYNYAGAPAGLLSTNDYVFFATKAGQLGIICDYAQNTCCDNNTAGTKTNCQ